MERGIGCNGSSSISKELFGPSRLEAIFCEREISFLPMPNSADPAQS